MSKESNSPVYLIIVFEQTELLVLCKRRLESITQIIERSISYTEDCNTVAVQTFTEEPEIIWKVRGNNNTVH